MSMTAKLVPETKILDQLPIALQIGPLHVLEKTAPLANHLEQPAAGVMVLLMRTEVIRQVVDPLGQ